MLANERAYNLPRLQKVKEMLDNGEIKDKKEFWKNNDVWEQNDEGYCQGWVACIGVQCPMKAQSTINECPIAQKECWWVYAHNWLMKNDKAIKGRTSFMRKYSDR